MSKTKKIGMIFILFAFILTIISQSIYNYMIPNVYVGNANGGKLDKKIEKISVANTQYNDEINAVHGGIVENVYFEIGDKINIGDVLFDYNKNDYEYDLNNLILDSEKTYIEIEKNKNSNNNTLILDYENIISTNKSQLTKKESDLKFSKEELINAGEIYEKSKILFNSGVISQNELNESKAKYDLKNKEVSDISNDIISINNEISNSENIIKNLKKDDDDKIKYDTTILEIEYKQKLNDIDKLKDSITRTKSEVSNLDGEITDVYVRKGDNILPSEKVFDIKYFNSKYEVTFDLTNEQSNILANEKTIKLIYTTDKSYEIICDNFEIKNAGDENNNKKIIIKFNSDLDLDGQTMTLLHNLDSEYYDHILPNSAIKYDGKNYYVLETTTENQLLGTKTIAHKKIITILDKNEINTAVSAIDGFLNPIIIKSDDFVNDSDKVYVKLTEN